MSYSEPRSVRVKHLRDIRAAAHYSTCPSAVVRRSLPRSIYEGSLGRMDLDYDDIVYIRDVNHGAPAGREDEAVAAEVVAREVEAAFIRSASEALKLDFSSSPEFSHGSPTASMDSLWLQRRVGGESSGTPISSASQTPRRRKRGAFERARARRYVYLLQRGQLLRKKKDFEKGYTERFVFVSEDLQSLCWCHSASQRHLAKSVPLLGLRLRIGPPPVCHKRDLATPGFAACTLSVLLPQPYEKAMALDLRLEREASCLAWSECLFSLTHWLSHLDEGPTTPQPSGGATCPFLSVLAVELAQASVARYFEARALLKKKKKSPHEAACFRGRPLSHPLTELTAEGAGVRALESFSLILQYMGDLLEPGGQGGQLLVLQRVVALGYSVRAIRDEMYMQLLKQTSENPRDSSLARGWELLLGCVHTFLPLDAVLQDCVWLHADRARWRGDAVGGLAFHVYCVLCEGNRWKRRPALTSEALSTYARNSVPPSVFGGSLDDVLRREEVLGSLLEDKAVDPPSPGVSLEAFVVPQVLQCLVRRFHELQGYATHGIFRTAADTDSVAELRRSVDDGSYMAEGSEAIATEDVLAVADLIKGWLRSLHEPLIPHHMYEEALAAAQAENCRAAFNLLLGLKPANLETLLFVLRFLNGCANQSSTNQMTALNLSLIFTPNLLHNPTDDPHIMMANGELERRFILHLLDAVRMVDEEDVTSPVTPQTAF